MNFLKLVTLAQVFEHLKTTTRIGTEKVALKDAFGRILAIDFYADTNLPAFKRATMDGFAVVAASTYGASGASPAMLTVVREVMMGEAPDFHIQAGEAAAITTGGMLPEGADSVVMLEQTETIDDSLIEVYASVGPQQNMIAVGEDFKADEILLEKGCRLQASEIGLLAAFGIHEVTVFQQPVIGIISTGDEIIPIDHSPDLGEMRDINAYTLAALSIHAGCHPLNFGIIKDDPKELLQSCQKALDQSDLVLISGGSSKGVRDFTIEVFTMLQSEILVNGISISPGKPTILARLQNKMIWGLPGHVVSAMVVFTIVVQPFIDHLCGAKTVAPLLIPAKLTRPLPSAQGRTDYVRVRLTTEGTQVMAEPLMGKSGLLNTMVKAQGIIEIGLNCEGLVKGAMVMVKPIN